MKIQYLSDLHLEFKENLFYIHQDMIEAVGDILIIAGDLVLFKLLEKQPEYYQKFFEHFSDNWKAVYWLPGNHEYYYYEAANQIGSFKQEIRPNVFLINNSVEYFDDCRIIFSTLWSKIEKENVKAVQSGMSDFHVIEYNGSSFNVEDYNKLFEEDFNFIQEAISKPFRGKTIIVTHHVPTLINYPLKYLRSPINNGFVTELKDFIMDNKIDYWIYGHHHANVHDFKIGNTILTTNQLGYVHHNEQVGFDDARFISI